MAVTGVVTNIQRCSTEDGPGIRTTVFLKGCPLRCLWCHNIENIDPKPQLVWYAVKCIGDQSCVRACPEHALELTPSGIKIDRTKCTACGDCEAACPTNAMRVMGRLWKSDELVTDLLSDKVFFATSGGGVTLSGGEPSYQPEFASEVALGLRREGVHVAIETSGYCSKKVMEMMISSVDLVMYDLKQMDPEKHVKYTGVPLKSVLVNARLVASKDVPTWVRTPVIPNHTDDEANIRGIARFIVKSMPRVERYELLAFNNMCVDKYALFGLEYPLKGLEPLPRATMEHLAEVARQEGLKNVVWSGLTRRESPESQSPSTAMDSCGRPSGF